MVVRRLPNLAGLLAPAAFAPVALAAWKYAAAGPTSARRRAVDVGIGHETGRTASPLQLSWFRDDESRLAVTWQATTDD